MQSGLLLKYWGLAPCWCTMHSFQQSCLYQEAFPWPLQYSLNQDANYWPTRAGQGAVMLTKSGLAGKPSGRGACIWKPLRRHGRRGCGLWACETEGLGGENGQDTKQGFACLDGTLHRSAVMFLSLLEVQKGCVPNFSHFISIPGFSSDPWLLILWCEELLFFFWLLPITAEDLKRKPKSGEFWSK